MQWTPLYYHSHLHRKPNDWCYREYLFQNYSLSMEIWTCDQVLLNSLGKNTSPLVELHNCYWIKNMWMSWQNPRPYKRRWWWNRCLMEHWPRRACVGHRPRPRVKVKVFIFIFAFISSFWAASLWHLNNADVWKYYEYKEYKAELDKAKLSIC